MAHQRRAVSQYRGRYYRNLGRVLKPDGKLTSKKFLLGTDQTKAELRNRLLEQLWSEVEAEHEDCLRFKRELGGRLGDADDITGRLLAEARDLSHGPVWRAESLQIGEAVRKGQCGIDVQVGDDAGRPAEYVRRIARLRQTYSVIAFAPADPALYAEGQGLLRQNADDQAAEAQASATLASTTVPIVTGPTLHQALDSYAQHISEHHNGKEYGRVEAAATLRLKHSHEDVPLAQFSLTNLQRIRNYWAGRPKSRRTGKPIALDTVRNQLKTAKGFVRWLHRTDLYEWSKPAEADDVLRANVDRLRTDKELSRLKDGVPVWRVDELATLYRHATEPERALMLLALNCGFQQADMGNLRWDEIDRDGASGTIKRIRRKSRVYGEFVLWPETLQALDWLHAHRHKPKGEHADYVVLTQTGQPFSRQRIANLWNGLLNRVQKEQPAFRRLSFKYLRKTAGELVRQRSTGEIAAVFLCHGQAVVSDELSDRYSNRPFGKVADALHDVHEELRPMYEAAPEPFGGKGKRGRRSRTSPRVVAAK